MTLPILAIPEEPPPLPDLVTKYWSDEDPELAALARLMRHELIQLGAVVLHLGEGRDVLIVRAVEHVEIRARLARRVGDDRPVERVAHQRLPGCTCSCGLPLLGDITLPADGENIDAADVNGPLQDIADGVKYVEARGLLDVETVALSSLQTTTSTSFGDVTGLSITLSGGAVGDVVIVDFTGYGQVDAATLRILVRINDGTNRDNIPGSATNVRENDADAAEVVHTSCHFSYVVAGAGDVVVTVRFASSDGGEVGLHGTAAETSSLRAQLFRPRA